MTDTTKRRGPTFSAYVLLSAPLKFNTSEIEAALRQRFPSLELGDSVPMPFECDTDDFITSPILFGAEGADVQGSVNLIRLPGYGTWDPDGVPPALYAQCPNLPDRLRRNKSYICVSTGAGSHGLLEAFRAARLCSAVASLFASRSEALAVFWEPAGHFLSPEEMIRAADAAISDDWPIPAWVHLAVGQGLDEGRKVDWSRGVTQGLSAFKGYELSAPVAPIRPAELAKYMMATMNMTLAHGSEFNDGDTMAMEDGSGVKWRFRHIAEGVEDNPIPLLALIHPQSKYDAEDRLGKPLNEPPPPGFDNRRPPKQGWFKRLLRGARAH